MALRTTPLSVIINRMNRWQSVYNVEELYKVYDIDEALRTIRRQTVFPWDIKKTTLKVFKDVLEYPVAADHDEIIYVDNNSKGFFFERARFRYTSLQEFYENPDDRNDMAEIWDSGVRYLGLRYQDLDMQNLSVNPGEDSTLFTPTDDATAVTDDSVVYKEGNGSVRISITSSSGTATITNSCTQFSDTEYKRKYYFRWVYLDSVPTSIELRIGNDASNYLSSGAITTQFSGQTLKADDWNLVAFDLNTATETGTFNETAIDYEALIFTGASTGEYRINSSYLREWTLMDYWYASINNIATTGASSATKEYFMDNNGSYEITDELVGDSEWADVLMYEALVTTITDVENNKIFPVLDRKRQEAWDSLLSKYPAMDPNIITHRWRFASHGNNIDSDGIYLEQ